ncbi:MAG: hypothetical protein BGO31_07510 [Bacteroidetes bacterium 43-16]|nr:MAG: hypothetical protein BGO31_07510 [Bacteroidetes bacterium 43-16]
MVGKYNGITQGSLPNTSTNYVLELTDSTFNLKINGHDYNPECNGKWEIKNHILVLLCNEENDLGIILSSGYMNQQKFILNIKDKNTLILNNVVLKRIDNL